MPAQPCDVVGVAEIAHRAGTTPNMVQAWRSRYREDFPAPHAELSMGPVWLWDTVHAWLLATGREKPRGPGRPRKV